MNNNEWLKSLKPGDKIIVDSSKILKQYFISTIEKVTPKGWIKVKDVNGYFKDGRQYSTNFGFGVRLIKYTEEKYKECVLLMAGKKLSDFNWYNLRDGNPDLIFEIHEKIFPNNI